MTGTGDRGIRAIAAEDFSVEQAIGGVRGIVESVLPGLVFVVLYVATSDLRLSLIVSAAAAVAAVVLRLVQGTPVTQALSGILGVGIGVVWAWRSGESKNFFAWGLWVNSAWFLGALVSIVVRWPAVGVLVGLLRSEDTTWRTAPEHRGLRRRYVLATWVWVALFGSRLAVQVPLYQDSTVGWLGTAKLVMGIPLFALALWLSWLLVRRPAAVPAPSRQHLDP